MSDGSNGVIANPLRVKCLGKACWNPWASPRKDAKTRAPRPLSTLLRIKNVARNIGGIPGYGSAVRYWRRPAQPGDQGCLFGRFHRSHAIPCRLGKRAVIIASALG
jgi:hypothetical protein